MNRRCFLIRCRFTFLRLIRVAPRLASLHLVPPCAAPLGLAAFRGILVNGAFGPICLPFLHGLLHRRHFGKIGLLLEHQQT